MVGEIIVPRSERDTTCGTIVDKTAGKFTVVSLVPYSHVSEGGIISRQAGVPRTAAFIADSPWNVMEALFNDFTVTRYNGCELYSRDNLYSFTPMKGIGIDPVERIYGINGDLAELLEHEGLKEVRRKSPISRDDAKDIMIYLSGFFNLGYSKQEQRDRREIIDIISGVTKVSPLIKIF
ncbi:hypothetical protein HY638_02930 [Candidatus Woesearchaeota archaeon]|nr:hypothetical protein [Candidatus Woesearchaeota archaeon]